MATGENGRVRDDDGRKIDHKTLEALRMRAVEQVAAGARPEAPANEGVLTRPCLRRTERWGPSKVSRSRCPRHRSARSNLLF
jgi:hypothetical protein